MIFTVVWTAAAERELTAIWLAPANRAVVSAAANEIDRTLRVDPDQQGESRDFGQRILLETPLGVTFEVFSDDKLVHILDVWQFETHSR
jgi:hypothetical protein